jgi:DNA invertase Pin-like site-specific DNA recombinase/ribosomal protein L34E
MNGRPLVPYLRQSRAKERTISIEEQRREVVRFAADAGVELAPEVVEQNVSGSKPWRERALGDAVAACERGEASGIIVAWQDRLSRENGRATAEVWEALEKAGARLVCAAEGLDTATGDHEMLFTIKAAIAREQWKRYRANWEGARASAIERGVPAGRASYGYRRRKGSGQRMQPDAKRAARVLEAFELRASGVSESEVGRRMGWSHSSTRQLLANRVYLGEIRHGGNVNENAHDAIVPRDLFDRVQAMHTPTPAGTGELTRERVVQGIAVCAGCGHTLKVLNRRRTDGSRVFSYYCKNTATEPCADRAYVHCDVLDDYVSDFFAKALRSTPRMVDVVTVGLELDVAQAERAEAVEQLNAFIENADATKAELFQRGISARERRVEEAREKERHLAARLPRLPVGGSLIDLWEGFEPAERREILASFLGRVVVSRGASSSLEGNVVIEWADGTVANHETRVRVAAA